MVFILADIWYYSTLIASIILSALYGFTFFKVSKTVKNTNFVMLTTFLLLGNIAVVAALLSYNQVLDSCLNE